MVNNERDSILGMLELDWELKRRPRAERCVFYLDKVAGRVKRD